MARRVNTKFLVIFSVIVVGGIATAFLAAGPLKGLFHPDRSKKLIEQADALMKEGEATESLATKREKFEGAVRSYQQAAASDVKNPELFVKLGDAFNKLTQYDVNIYINATRMQWEKALEIDPTYLPALRRLQDSYQQETQLTAAATSFSRLEEKASAIHKLDPADLKAHSLMYIAPLNQWLANIETPANKIDMAIVDLGTLVEKNPNAPEIPDMVFFLAGAKAKRGFENKRGGQERAGNDLIAASMKIFQDAIKAQEKNAYLHYRYYELLRVILSEDRERDNTQRYTETFKSELEKAKELVTPDNDAFVKIYVAAHELALSRNDPKKAEQILLDLRAAKPDDQRVRMALARLWRYDQNKSKRDEAIELLKLPIVNTGLYGVEARQKLELELQSKSDLANMYIDQYGSLPEAERPAALKQIEATYEQICSYSMTRERSFSLKIRGKIELLRGGPDATVKAIQTFEKAQAQFRTENVRNQEDLDLMFLLARAYLASHQTGQAKTQLLRYKERRPDFIPVRLMLAQVLIIENDVAAAREHVEFLERQAPEEPEVIRLVLAVLDPVKEAIKVKAYFDKLPEEKRPERMSKAQIASLSPVNNPDEAVRIFKLVLAENAGDFEALQGVREVLMAQGAKDPAVAAAKKAEALALLKAGQAVAKGDDASKIALLMSPLEGASDKDIQAAARALIRKTNEKDPYMCELKLYQFELYAAGKEEAFKHLEAAEKLKPDEAGVLDLMFQYYLSEQKWDRAGEYVEKLAAKNYDQAGGLIYRYRLNMSRGAVQAALDNARELTNKLPEFARSYLFLGQALQANGQYDAAISQGFTLALEKQSENPEAMAGIISCYFQMSRPNDAFRYITMGLKAHPNNAFFREQWRNYQMQWGNPSEVIKPALVDRDARPDDVNRWIGLGRAQYAAARKRDKDAPKYIADAKATFTEAQKKWPGEKLIWAFLSEIADFNHDVAGGEALLKDMAAREEFKATPEPLMMLADYYLRNDKAADAEATMKQAIEKFKDNVDVKRRLAAYYTQNKRYDDALKLLDPSSPDKLVRQQTVEVYMLANKFAEAEKLLRGLLTSNPSDAQLHALLGVVMLNQNREEQALDSLNTALSLDPKNQAALYSRGQLRLKSKVPQLDDAIKDLAVLVGVNPGHVEGHVSLAEAYRQKQRFDEATSELDAALRRMPLRRDIRITLAGLYASAKPPQWGEAERLVTQARALEPREPLWSRMLAKMYSVRGQHERAALEIRDAMEMDRQNAVQDPKWRMSGDLVRDYLDILETGKMWPQLLAETDRLIATDKNVSEKGWWVFVKRAIARRSSGQTQEAMADFQKSMDIVQADPNASQDVLIAIVDKIREHMGPDAAIARAMMLSNGNTASAVRWKVVLAYLYFQNKETGKAVTTIEEARAKSASLDERNQLTALNVAGTIFMMNGDYDRARTAYEELISKRPDDLGALNNLACLVAEHAEPPNIPKALEYCNRAYETMKKRNVEEPNVLDTVGWINVLAGGINIDRGIEFLNSSIKADPDGGIVEAHYHLGEAFMRKGFPDVAKGNLTKATQMIADMEAKKKLVDASLKQKIATALDKAVKASSEPRAGNP